MQSLQGGWLEIPITDADRGGFGLNLVVLRDHQLMQLSQSVYVPWDNKELKVEFETFRDKLRPGNKETWRVKLKGPTGVAAYLGDVLVGKRNLEPPVAGPHHVLKIVQGGETGKLDGLVHGGARRLLRFGGGRNDRMRDDGRLVLDDGLARC